MAAASKHLPIGRGGLWRATHNNLNKKWHKKIQSLGAQPDAIRFDEFDVLGFFGSLYNIVQSALAHENASIDAHLALIAAVVGSSVGNVLALGSSTSMFPRPTLASGRLGDPSTASRSVRLSRAWSSESGELGGISSMRDSHPSRDLETWKF